MRFFGIELIRHRPDTLGLIKIRTDPHFIDVLHDPAFQRSIDAVRRYTLIDTARLANLWQLCRMSNPAGAILEAGTFRGGTALHLHNSSPDRKLFLCDTFEGMNKLPMNERLDRRFRPRGTFDTGFAETSAESVRRLIARHTGNFELIVGCFPDADVAGSVRDVSFVHMDFDLYKSILDSLLYLEERMLDRSIIVVDDYRRTAEGVTRAVDEFIARTRNWLALPVYPGQGVLLHRSWLAALGGAATDAASAGAEARRECAPTGP